MKALGERRGVAAAEVAARAAGDGGADSERGMLRRAMGAWQGAVVARLRADRQTDAAAAKRATKPSRRRGARGGGGGGGAAAARRQDAVGRE